MPFQPEGIPVIHRINIYLAISEIYGFFRKLQFLVRQMILIRFAWIIGFEIAVDSVIGCLIVAPSAFVLPVVQYSLPCRTRQKLRGCVRSRIVRFVSRRGRHIACHDEKHLPVIACGITVRSVAAGFQIAWNTARLVVVTIHRHGKIQLLHVAHAGNRLRPVARFRQSRQKHSRKNGNDCYNDEKFDQGENPCFHP